MKKEANKEYIKKIVKISNKHFKKHGFRKMTVDKLGETCGL
ncbi:MAG: hypothetical protein WC796_05400 [Candidatus Pacearchaeota archaeon]|jgi:hypothetical protein